MSKVTWCEFKIGRLRFVFWRFTLPFFPGISFGWLPRLTRDFYGGGSNVLTWGPLWFEWDTRA